MFVSAILGVMVLADWIRTATEQLAGHTGPAVGGVLTISLGSIAECCSRCWEGSPLEGRSRGADTRDAWRRRRMGPRPKTSAAIAADQPARHLRIRATLATTV